MKGTHSPFFPFSGTGVSVCVLLDGLAVIRAGRLLQVGSRDSLIWSFNSGMEEAKVRMREEWLQLSH